MEPKLALGDRILRRLLHKILFLLPVSVEHFNHIVVAVPYLDLIT